MKGKKGIISIKKFILRFNEWLKIWSGKIYKIKTVYSWGKLLSDETLIDSRLVFWHFSPDLAWYWLAEPAWPRMYRTKYSSQTDLGSVSLEEEEPNTPNTLSESYLTRVLGDELSSILTECANLQPRDPILFLASELQRSGFHENDILSYPDNNSGQLCWDRRLFSLTGEIVEISW